VKTLRTSINAWANAMQRRITPGLPYSQTVYQERLTDYVGRATRWLDLGCGHHVLPEWRGDEEAKLVKSAPFVVGLDADYDAIKRHRSISNLCLGDISRLPFRDGSFDLVTANMVVEHLADPAGQFAEVARVLVPRGIFLFHTPNVRSYAIAVARLFPDPLKRRLAGFLDGRDSADIYPTHYRANRDSDIRAIAERGGLAVSGIEFVLSSPAFNLLPPVLLAELLWIRQLRQRPSLAKYRHTLICALERRKESI
jgi:SAM-dependent methyltransferase